MSAILCLVLMFIILVAIVIFHEAGHYYVARHYGITASSFNIGMGPKLFTFGHWNGTEWNVRLFPIGGSCDFGNEAEEQIKKLKPTKRMAIFFAGPAVNFVLGLVCWFFGLLIIGRLDYFGQYFNTCWQTLLILPEAIASMFSKETATIYHTAATMARVMVPMALVEQVSYMFTIAAVFNAILFVTNLLPIPGLDGGQIVLAIPEVFHHPIPEKIVDRLNMFFVIIIMTASVAYLVKDIIFAIPEMMGMV